jgi:aspartate/methionine/tyrosine aminotransferase
MRTDTLTDYGISQAVYEKTRLALQAKPPYEKMLELYKAMLFYGDYQGLKPLHDSETLFMLDNVNFSSALVPDPLPLHELLGLVTVEPGYATITGDCEIGDLLRELEYQRASRYARRSGLKADPRRVIDGTVAVVTSGATGAANTVLTATMHRDIANGGSRREIVFNVPCYCLPESFARIHGLIAKPIEGGVENDFLPSLDDVRAAIGPRTLACFLTFPANPSLASWGARDLAAFRHLIQRCQETGAVLVVDTVFQDMEWGPDIVPEIFALAESPTLLAKLHSPSKDRPMACGYRVGYLLADAALEPWLHQAEAGAKNSNNTTTLAWLAFDSLFRLAMFQGHLREDDFSLLEKRHLYGYGAPELTAAQMYARVQSEGFYDRYVERVSTFKRTIYAHLAAVHEWLAGSVCFEPRPLPKFGNLLMVRIRPPFDHGGEMKFFLDSLIATRVTSTVGSAFGMDPDRGLWIRVAAGGAVPGVIIAALGRLQDYLIQRSKQ